MRSFRTGSRNMHGRLTLLTAAMAFVLSAGCGGGQAARQTVTGKVTFQGAPVEEGTVTFEDSATGVAGSAEIGPGGVYSMELPDGSYKVSVAPPMVETAATADTPGDVEYKKMESIPQVYWTTGTSALTAEVSSTATSHDFDLKP